MVDWEKLEEELLIVGNMDSPILLSLIPHENEPLGSLLDVNKFYKKTSLCLNLDIPDLSHRFSIPCNFYDFLTKMYLSPLNQQVEFSYSTSNQFHNQRTKRYFELWKNKKIIIQIHNDPLRNQFYMYSWINYPELNAILQIANRKFLGIDTSMSDLSYTIKLNTHIFSFFPIARIDNKIKTISFGEAVKKQNVIGINIEVPMFNWSAVDPRLKKDAINAYVQKINNISEQKFIDPKFKSIEMIDFRTLYTSIDFIMSQFIAFLTR